MKKLLIIPLLFLTTLCFGQFGGGTTQAWVINYFNTHQPVIGLGSLTDVSLNTPVSNNVLMFNGADWINSPIPSATGVGVQFFLDETAQVTNLQSLLKTPSAHTQTSASASVNATTSPVLIQGFMYANALGGTQIDGGEWAFDTYCQLSSATGTSFILTNVNQVIIGTGTVTTTGTLTSRTATVTGGIPFVSADANANRSLCSYLQTPSGIFAISGFTDNHTVTITTLAGYVNENGVAYNTHRFLFQNTGPSLSNTSISITTNDNVQQAFPINSTDKLSFFYFASGTGATARTITLYYEGTANYSHVHVPIVLRHNDLAAIQGGNGTEEYHLTLAQYNSVQYRGNNLSFSGTVDLTTYNSANYNDYTISSNLAITVASSPVDGNTAGVVIIGDGTHTPTFTG